MTASSPPPPVPPDDKGGFSIAGASVVVLPVRHDAAAAMCRTLCGDADCDNLTYAKIIRSACRRPVRPGSPLPGGSRALPPINNPQTMIRNLALDAALLLGLAVVGFAGYKLAPLLEPRTDIALPLSTCDLARQTCTASLADGGEVELSIEPRPIPALKPLLVKANFSGIEVRKAEIDFAGTEMKMGYNRPQLARQAEREGSGSRFAGNANLPVCITGGMEWEATLLVDTGKAVIAQPFRFVVGSD
ncbi:MAG: hypothetical protein RKP46_03500 [Candidatus Accumulibacter sp.]|uniref:hypothetical protein n=1 Tax=Accumulibacter sp. TaxID=2053492 RepID=UPI002878E706|nr:hypothetical protein [Accumulibacter sp.]MDS4013405.1 hypothetical protein [Accumulibacter sp.]